jgi:deoxyribonuclease-4
VASEVSLRFGTAGLPLSTPRPGTVHGIRRARELGLECLEMAWGNGVRMSGATADRIHEARDECGLELTAHAPYYINLCGAEDVVERSVARLVEAGVQAGRCGAASFCFHPGWYGGQAPAVARRRVASGLRQVTRGLRERGVSLDVRPEITGKPSQVGTLDEILAWSAVIPGIRPGLDFSHQYARHQGAFNRHEDFLALLGQVSARLGRDALSRLHVHISGIEFGPGGERRHLPLMKSKFRWRDLLRALREVRASGWVICETPAMEEDALRLQRFYRRIA